MDSQTPGSDPAPAEAGSGGLLEAALREKIRKLEGLGVDPWGVRFDGHAALNVIRRRTDEIEYRPSAEGAPRRPPAGADIKTWLEQQPPGEWHGPEVRAAGRIVLQRKTGKLIFLDIRDWTGRIQIFIGRKQVGEESWAIAECLDLGDLLGVDGQLRYTKTGELTIFAERLHFLTKSIETPPEKHKGLTDPGLRQRMRYLDLAYNEGSLERFLSRSRIVQSIRTTLAAQSFVEVEGPTLHTIAGGAAARPFTTHHNAL
ncbi:MAG: hypothetical protein JNG90_10915, partial [Planctomycetaceae bacterium]|nr:hypothetical protein [Planctomycetaceae bacterium]